MTTRRIPIRPALRTITPQREMLAWQTLFEFGWDFFHDLPGIGLDERTVTMRQVREAWHRLGRLYLAVRQRDPLGRERPWAEDEFGVPR